jgi:hypothetical protein
MMPCKFWIGVREEVKKIAGGFGMRRTTSLSYLDGKP